MESVESMENKLKAHRAELRCPWVGPMPLGSFFDTFLKMEENRGHVPEYPNDYFNAMPPYLKDSDSQSESEMVQSFVRVPNYSLIAPGLKLSDTRNGQPEDRDNDSKVKNQPDIIAHDARIDATNAHLTSYSQAGVIFEFHPGLEDNVADPFDDLSEMATEDDLEKFLWARTANKRRKYRAQITWYARMWMANQHRTHCFVVWIGDPYARVIRFDRDGAIVTEPFDIRSQSRLLLEFLWRFSCASPEMRGVDTTVSIVTESDEIQVAKDKLAQWAPRNSREVMRLRISDDRETRDVLAWGPLAEPRCVVGRATRGYAAWDLTDKKLVFVKDSWRDLEKEFSKETDILKALNNAEVCNVPKLVCGDDLPGQTTRTREFSRAEWNKGCLPETLSKRAHIRFTSDTIGIPLKKFKSSKDFVQAWLDALLAHEEAYTKCKILHRDISVNNIMFRPEGGGFLNDWDLARTLDDIEADPCQSSRSGTWQFMSIDLLGKPDKKHTLQDDLEGFLWVLLYVTIRYLLTSLVESSASVRRTLQSIFDMTTINGHLETLGGHSKHFLVVERRFIGQEFHVTTNEPLSELIDAIIGIFRVHRNFWNAFPDDVQFLVRKKRISLEAAKKMHLAENEKRVTEFSSHDAMIELVRGTLEEEWPTGDGPFDYCSATSAQSKKRATDDTPEGPLDVGCGPGPQQKRSKTETQ